MRLLGLCSEHKVGFWGDEVSYTSSSLRLLAVCVAQSLIVWQYQMVGNYPASCRFQVQESGTLVSRCM